MNGRRRIVLVVLAALVLIAGAVWVAMRLRTNDEKALFASGTVEATEADLGFQAPGRVTEITPREGDAVRRGALLARLDPAELDARRSAADAQVAAARAQLEELQHGARSEDVAQARAAVVAATQRLADARRDLERVRRLHDGGAASRESLDKAQTAVEVLEAQHQQAAQALRALERGVRPERIGAQQAVVRQTEAAVAQVDAAIANAVIRAPFDAIVTVRHREPGEIVSPGVPVLTLMNPADRWVKIYVREDEIGRVRLGQRAEIESDSYPGRDYTGQVVFISSRAEFTPRNVQTAEERVKLVYAVKVRVIGDPSHDLKPGVPADVRLLETPGSAAARP